MKRIASVLTLLGVCVAPAWADEPDAGSDPQVEIQIETVDETVVDVGTVDDVDPIIFQTGVVDDPVCHVGHGAVDIDPNVVDQHDAHCHELHCECPNPLLTPVPPDGGELPVMMFSLSNTAADTGAQPMMNARGLETAALATQRNAAISAEPARGLLLDQSLRGHSVSPAVTATGAPKSEQPGMFAQLLVRNETPAAVTAQDRDYAQRLAAIDQLRDQALRTGNSQQLAEAARQERELKSASAPRGFRLFRR